MSNGKTNRYGFLFYPESLDFNSVFGTLRATHTMSMISPLHDSDVWMADDLYRRCLDLWRNDSSGFLTVERSAHVFDGFAYHTNDDSNSSDTVTLIRKNKKELQLADFLIDVLVDGKRHVYNSFASIPDDLEIPFACTTVTSVVWHPKKGDDLVLPIVGETKKAHYHVIVKFDYSMTPSQALNKLGIENSISYLEPINSEKGYIRYLCHLDDPDKAQYSISDVVTIGGYSSDPLYIQGAVDQELATMDLYEIAQDVRSKGGDFKEMLDIVMGCDWKTRKAFRSNQAMWRSYLYRPLLPDVK